MKLRKYSYLALCAVFLLGNYKGFLALWENPSLPPRVVFPYLVESLPEKDQRAVNQGLRIDTQQQLHCLLEDFLS